MDINSDSTLDASDWLFSNVDDINSADNESITKFLAQDRPKYMSGQLSSNDNSTKVRKRRDVNKRVLAGLKSGRTILPCSNTLCVPFARIGAENIIISSVQNDVFQTMLSRSCESK